MTSQRRLIFDTLKASQGHPTAYEIYEAVRARLPQISLATVYRNLDVLCQAGEAGCVEIAGTQRRFDGYASPHYHVRCSNCGAVSNVDMARVPGVEEMARTATDYRILGHRIDFAGICPRCTQGAGAAAGEQAVMAAGRVPANGSDFAQGA